MHTKPAGAGRSSFDLLDADAFFRELAAEPGISLVDVGSGVGEYTLRIARRIGPGGVVFAVDPWPEGVEQLRQRVMSEGITNVKAYLADAGRHIPIEDRCGDMALLATVLHDLKREGAADGALREIGRVLKPGGRLVVVEFKKVEGPPGPPLAIRISPEETEHLVVPHGFSAQRVADVGPYLYLIHFRKETGG